ncbi:MAG: DNA polymerase I [Candidatus Komeilibacteria bacterium]
MSKQKKLVVIDTYSLLHRAWHAIPPLTTKDGTVVNAVFGFTSILLRLIRELKPDYLLAAFDLAAPTFRHEEFKEYKAQREKQPDELYNQVVLVEQILDALEIPRLSQPGYEADDIIGSIVTHNCAQHKDIKNIIVTGDNDSLQLVNKQTEVYTMKRGINDTITYDVAAVKERYGLEPKQLIELKAIMGDTSDNIPGVKGIGEKGAQTLIQEFGSLDGVYKHLDSPKIKDRLRELLRQQKEQAWQSRKLVTIVTDLPVKVDLKQAAIHQFDRQKVYQIFKQLEFTSLIDKIPRPEAGYASNPTDSEEIKSSVSKIGTHHETYELIKGEAAMKKMAQKLSQQTIFALDTETTGLDPLQDKLLGASFSWKEAEAYFVSLRTDADRKLFVKLFGPILSDKKIHKVGHNLKFDYEVLKCAGVEVGGIIFDSLIAAFLIKPDRGLKLEELAFNHFGLRMQPLAEIAQGKKNNLDVAGVPEETLSWYAAEDADFAWRLYQTLKKELTDLNLAKLNSVIETPLIPILGDMELAGISLDVPLLKKLEKRFDQRLAEISQKIHTLAGREFNIASPLQLKEILFDVLAVDTKGLKKTKTGISTAASELDKLQGRHPIIPWISEYRELAKLQSTYITALPQLLSPVDKRIHTSFNQTVAVTGRLSSNNPNLQNIPIRTEIGREIRQAFIADKGYRLLSADYSQIELRLAAHISGDPVMIKSFNNGEDIHTATAAKINKIPLEQVSKDERRKAKEVNFGVIYGLGSLGLAQRTGISRDEAKEFIAKYFQLYKGVKKYIEETKLEVRDAGYVETLFGRRRYLPEINSTMPQLIAQAERMAVNMPLQGSAADIIKQAMIQLAVELPKISINSRLLLQVHDELVLEVPQADLPKVGKLVKKIMEGVTRLKVPLIVDLKAGHNWAEMKEVSS